MELQKIKFKEEVTNEQVAKLIEGYHEKIQHFMKSYLESNLQYGHDIDRAQAKALNFALKIFEIEVYKHLNISIYKAND